MSELETKIMDISEDALDSLFDETPDKTVNADTLLGGKKPQKQDTSDEDFEDVEDEDVEETPKKQQKKKAVPKAKKQEPVIEDFEDDDFEEIGDEDDFEDEENDEEPEEDEKAKKAAKKAQKAEQAAEQKDGVFGVLKNTVDYLIQQGAWEDFDGRDEMELNEETYAQLVLEQDRRRVQGMFEELVDSTGAYGKAIIDYVKNGGNPDEIIDLFKEQKQVDSINIDSLEGQKEILKHYYTDVMGWKGEKADRYINNLVLSNELEDEAKEIKDLFTSHYQKEAQRLNSQREAALARQREAEEAFEGNIRSTVRERKDLSPSEKRMVEDYLLRYDQKLPNGNLVNKFYVNFAKMQSNPQDYIDLVLFVMDKQKFVQKVATKEKSQAAADAFKFIKGNGAVSSKKGSGYDQVRKNDKMGGFDWGLPSR